MILGEATGGAPNCLSPAKWDEFLGRTEQAIEASKYAAADEENLALCRIINVFLSMCGGDRSSHKTPVREAWNEGKGVITP